MGSPLKYLSGKPSTAAFTKIDLLGFHLYRKTAEGELIRLNAALISSQSPGNPVGAIYTWLDKAVVADVTYYYCLEAVDIHGRATRHGPVSATVPPDSPYRLYLPVVFNRRWPTESTTC